MKYLKTYESNLEPEIYDYVIVKPDLKHPETIEYISKLVGIISILRKSYYVRYYLSFRTIDNMNDIVYNELRKYFHSDNQNILGLPVSRNEIVAWSKSKKELEKNKEYYLNLKKYNL